MRDKIDAQKFIKSALAALAALTRLPFGQYVRLTHPWHRGSNLWVTGWDRSLIKGHNWRYELRSDEPQAGSDNILQWGPVWIDECDLERAGDKPMSDFLRSLAVYPVGRRPGIWVANGHPGDTTMMYSWRPGAVTCIYDHLQANQVFEYRTANPSVPIIVRFMHPKNWQEDPTTCAKNYGAEIASKWNDLKVLDPYVYFANEMNLHYENGDPDVGNQHLYETIEFYQKYANWVRVTADTIKSTVPEMKLVTPPFAFGHHEDGAPENGVPKEGWAGYDYLSSTIKNYFDNILTFHAYWGDATGSKKERLYDPEISSWYAFRWRRVLELFEQRYKVKARMIIDEAGNFGLKDQDFFEQISYFGQECLEDERVLALTFFLWSDPTGNAGNLPNAWVQGIPDLPGLVAKLKAMPDVAISSTEPSPEPSPPDEIPEPEPPDTEPPLPEIKYTMTIETGDGLPIIVGNWVEAGKEVILISPSGLELGRTRTGNKTEYGEGGFEAGYANDPNKHELFIDGNEFEVDGGKFTRLSFKPTSDVNELTGRLVSKDLPVARLEKILLILESQEMTKGIFEIVED
jgi:hypothetical protein